MPVDEYQTNAAVATQSEQVAKEDAAVSAEHQCELAAGDEYWLDAIGQALAVRGDGGEVAHGLAVPGPAVARRHDDSCIARAEPFKQTLVAQRAGQLVDPW